MSNGRGFPATISRVVACGKTLTGFSQGVWPARQRALYRVGRLGIFVKSILRFLVNLKRHYPLLSNTIDASLISRYQGQKAKACFAGVKPTQSQKVSSEVASDLYRLVIQFQNHRDVANMSSYKLLCRIVNEQCQVRHDGTIELKEPKQIASDSLQNPSDPEATDSGHKGQGYQAQVMETYTEHEAEKKARELNLITYVQVESDIGPFGAWESLLVNDPRSAGHSLSSDHFNETSLMAK